VNGKPLEFKGRMLSLTRVRVVDLDLAGIEAQLRDFARQMPQAVRGSIQTSRSISGGSCPA
jgi:septum site-determining protein MinC